MKGVNAMIKLLVILLCFLLAGCQSTTAYTGEKETVWVLTEYTCYWDPWGWGDVTTSRYVYTYDIYGNVAISTHYSNDELQSRTINTYDERGNILTSQDYDCDGWIDLPSTHSVYTYDDQDRQLTATYTEFLKLGKEVTTRVYDDEAHTTEVRYSNGSYSMYHFNESGDIIRSYYENGSYSTDTVRTYDEGGNCILTETTATGLDYSCTRYEFTYDENGNPLSKVGYRDGVKISEKAWEYDDQNRSTYYSRWSDTDGSVTKTYVYEDGLKTTIEADGSRDLEFYDENGNVYLIESYNSEGVQTMSQRYTYTEIEIIPREED